MCHAPIGTLYYRYGRKKWDVFERYSLVLLSDSSTVDDHVHHPEPIPPDQYTDQHKLRQYAYHANIINKQPIISRAYAQCHNIIPVLYFGK